MTEQFTQGPTVVIIGAGGAGLSTSYYLTQAGVDHIVLERGQVGNTWATERWDAFHLVNPNWAVRLPSFNYGSEACGGDDPDGYLSRDETVDYLHRYAEHINARIEIGTEVESLSQNEDGRYQLILSDGHALNRGSCGRGDGCVWSTQVSGLRFSHLGRDHPDPFGPLQKRSTTAAGWGSGCRFRPVRRSDR